ncbi:MAG: 5-formyltetrahydrofolate cyclo-ligase [Methanomicrobiales archaeon]|nr:5-formyltetrahydrofolate cyclo-ligase [Methanomicrobiales archaeon]MDD1663256.1 5-formyltetrahydrofolate cyclo-ligase [Methanomicrobiales archaeon]
MREQKTRVRQAMRERREAMTPAERLDKSRRICGCILDLIRDGETVMVYSSKELEVNTRFLIGALIASGNPVIVPIIVREDVSLRLSYLNDPSVLVLSTFGVPEPIGSEIPARPENVDTIILPMLGYDREGGRLGYGAGYYDRFLARNPRIRRIGIAFSCQEADKIPCDENDIHMNLIITDEGIVYSDGMCQSWR